VARSRSRARAWALQALYAWEMRGAEPERALHVLDELAQELRVAPGNRLIAEVLVRIVGRERDRLDTMLVGEIQAVTICGGEQVGFIAEFSHGAQDARSSGCAVRSMSSSRSTCWCSTSAPRLHIVRTTARSRGWSVGLSTPDSTPSAE
jgi:hypothetical protein